VFFQGFLPSFFIRGSVGIFRQQFTERTTVEKESHGGLFFGILLWLIGNI